MTIADIVAAHRAGRPPAATIEDACARLAAYGDPALALAVRPRAEALAAAAALQRRGGEGLPLYGVPFAVKDNIDVAGLPTTMACPAAAYRPQRSAFVVERLEAAGAIPLFKTNLDQFATGLVGIRSPHGAPRNPIDAALIPGGSSSGSAVAVGAGIVPFALGTDTAGSGRVPALYNRIVGLKPTLGALSSRGVFPACRSLDTISIFAGDVGDAFSVFAEAAGYDADDPFSRPMSLGRPGAPPPHVRLGAPSPASRRFFGDGQAEAAYDVALGKLRALGWRLAEIDLEPFFAVARLLYEGPWVAERAHAMQDILARAPEAVDPVVRSIVMRGAGVSAVETFAGFYELKRLARVCAAAWRDVDALVLPTAPRLYTRAEIAADPVRLNAKLGAYTNFVNLLDLCALALPAGNRRDKLPSGLTFVAPAGRDAFLASLGLATEAALRPASREPRAVAETPSAPPGFLPLAVVGAHLSGMALNHQLTDAGGVFLRAVETAPDYRFYALPGGPPERPGLVRVAAGTGAGIAAEIWALPAEGFGRFVAGIPAPLGIGALRLADGTSAQGFLCEAIATQGARDISAFGSWRAYVAARAA